MSAAPEQQPPRAVDVPEAVLAAIHRYQAAVIDAVLRFGKGPAMREFVAAESALEAAIATALREAKEQGAADREDAERWRAFTAHGCLTVNEDDELMLAFIIPGESADADYLTSDEHATLRGERPNTACVYGRPALNCAIDAARAAEPEGSDA